MSRTWVPATVHSVDYLDNSITFGGDGIFVPAMMSVTGISSDKYIEEGDTVLVELDSDEYPIAVRHGHEIIWP